MAGDEHHPSPPKLLDLAEAVIEHNREADDDHDPYDAAVVDFIRRFDLDEFSCGNNDRRYRYDLAIYGATIDVYESDGRVRYLDVVPPSDGQ